MLLQTLPGTDALSFDDVVPKASSTETRRVAAAAFYHCLGKCFACLSDCIVMIYEGFSQFFQLKT